MKVEAGERIQHLLAAHIHMRAVTPDPIGKRRIRRWGEEQGVDGEAAPFEEPLDHQAAFGDEEIVRLQPAGSPTCA